MVNEPRALTAVFRPILPYDCKRCVSGPLCMSVTSSFFAPRTDCPATDVLARLPSQWTSVSGTLHRAPLRARQISEFRHQGQDECRRQDTSAR